MKVQFFFKNKNKQEKKFNLPVSREQNPSEAIVVNSEHMFDFDFDLMEVINREKKCPKCEPPNADAGWIHIHRSHNQIFEKHTIFRWLIPSGSMASSLSTQTTLRNPNIFWLTCLDAYHTNVAPSSC